jgi:hypothetical protein
LPPLEEHETSYLQHQQEFQVFFDFIEVQIECVNLKEGKVNYKYTCDRFI